METTAESTIEHLDNLEQIALNEIANGADATAIYAAYAPFLEAVFEAKMYEKAATAMNFIAENLETLQLDATETAVFYQRQGILALENDETEAAKTAFEQAFETLPEDASPELKAKICNALGSIALESGDFEEAIDLFEDAIEFYQDAEVDNPFTWSNLGLAYLENNNVEEAIHSFEVSLEISAEQGEHAHEKSLHLQLAAIYETLEDWTNALRQYHFAAEMQENPSEAQAKTYLSMVNVLLKLGKNQQAVTFFEKALDGVALSDNLEYRCDVYFQFANLLVFHEIDLDKALSFYQKNLELAQSDTENEEWRNLMLAKVEDSIFETKKKQEKKSKKGGWLFGRK